MTLTLMTLTTLSPKQPDSIVNRKSHYPSKNDKKGRIVFFQRKKEKNALKSKKKWFRWHFSPPQKAKIRGGKRQDERGKTRNFLIYFVKILIKRARKLGQSEKEYVLFQLYKAWYSAEVLHKTIPLIIIILQTNIILFRITFRSQIRSLSVTVIFGHFHFRGRKSPL